MTPGDGTFAMCAIERDLVYVGIIMTDLHGETLKRNLIAHILKQMADEGSVLYDVRYALYKKGAKADADAEPKKGTKNKGKTKVKEAPKKKKAKAGKKGKGKKEKKSKDVENEEPASDDESSTSDSHSEEK